MRHGTAKEERGGTRACGTAPRKVEGVPAKCGTAPRKGEHNPTRNRKFANANNVSRRFMLPFY